MAALLADHYDDSELEAGVIPNPLAQPLVGSRRTRSPSTSSFLAATFSSAQKRVCQETGAVVIEQGDQVFQLSRAGVFLKRIDERRKNAGRRCSTRPRAEARSSRSTGA